MTGSEAFRPGVCLSCLLLLLSGSTSAQDIEPGTYVNIPIGANALVLGGGRTSGEVVFDPTLPIDDAEAVKWFRMAAEQRFIKAQFSLGFMHQLGEGVPQNTIRAHMWFNLAARQGDTDAIQFSYGLASRMTPDQIAEAQWMARSWLTAH